MIRSTGVRQLARRLARSTTAHVAFGFVAMGAWAAFVNRDHGPTREAIAFLVQGALSGGLTLVLKRGLEAGHARLPRGLDRIAPPVLSCLLIALVLTTAHRLAGTPEILKT